MRHVTMPFLGQVQDEPGATQFAHALRHIAAEAAGAPLSDAQLAAVGALADLLASHVLRVRAMQTEPSWVFYYFIRLTLTPYLLLTTASIILLWLISEILYALGRAARLCCAMHPDASYCLVSCSATEQI